LQSGQIPKGTEGIEALDFPLEEAKGRRPRTWWMLVASEEPEETWAKGAALAQSAAAAAARNGKPH
jgi:hypothetical protein